MKKFYFLLITLLIGMTTWSQTKTWVGGNGSWTNPSKWTPAGVPAANNVIVFNDGSTEIISNVPVLTVGKLFVSGNTNLTLTGAGGLTINNSVATDFSISPGSHLTLANTVNITLAANATASISGTFTVNGLMTYNTNNAGSVTTVLSTGIIENKGVITSGDATKLVFQGGATYIHARNGGALPFASWHNNSNCNITGITFVKPTVATLDQEFGNFTWNSPGQSIIASLSGKLNRIDGNFRVVSTGSGNITLWDLNVGNLLVAGDYIQTGGTMVMINSAGFSALELSGNFNMSGGTLNNNGQFSFFVFNKAGLQTYTKTGGTITGNVNFLVNSTSTVDFGTYVLDGTLATFRLNSGAKIITANPAGLNSAGAVGTIQVGGTREFNTDATYEFRGASTGVFTTTTNPQVKDLIINNTAGSVTLAKAMTVTNRLTLTSGELNTTTTNLLTIADNATTIGASNASFVNGPLAKVGNDAFTFPVGKSGAGLRKIGITAGANTTTAFTAEFIRNDPHTIGTALGAGLARVSACEYWTLDRAGTNNVRVVLSWESNSGCDVTGVYVTQPATLRVARWNGTNWNNEGRLSSTGTNTSGTITSGIVNNFSPFALASSTAAENPLPVVFGDVKAYEKNNGVQIEWSNLTEKDVAGYTVERSANGSDFSAIGQQLPTSNQNDRADYDAFDAAPLQGTNYYRIKAEETTGKIVYSKVLTVNLGGASQGLRLYPNPVSGHQVTISLSNVRRGQYNLRVINAAGQDIHKQAITNQGSTTTQTIDLPSSIKPGVYNMIITGSDYRENKMFIVR
ncbi:MAG: T9SS type A sorting domain-containing protein [Chitinophagaceae bacterium]